MLKINLKQLEAFVATAEFSSFTKAAETLFLTQSTVSSHISALENVLGVRLIHRSARQRVTLTPQGEQVYRDAKEILSRCQALEDLGNHDRENRLVIGASTVPGQCLLPELMANYLQTCPDSRYVQLRGDSAQIHQYLAQGKANIGFVGTALNPKEYHYHRVAMDTLVLITANVEPYCSLYQQGACGLELLNSPMILREESSGTRQETERFLSQRGITLQQLHVIAQIDNPEAIKSSVSRNLGVSIMSALAAREEIRSGRLLSFQLGEPSAKREICITWRKDGFLTPAEKHFLEYVRSLPVTEE